MATNKQNIEIGLNSRYNGEGFKKLDGALRNASKGTRAYAQTVNQVLGKLASFDGVVGNVTRTATQFWAALAGGGIVGAVIAAITVGIKLWEHFAGKIELASERLKRLEGMHKAYERRLEIYRKAAERRAKEAEEEAERQRRAEEAAREAERKRLEESARGYERGIKYDEALRRLAAERHKEEVEAAKDQIKNIDGLTEEAKAQRLATLELKENIKARLAAAKANVEDRKRDVLAAKERVKAGGDSLQVDLAKRELEIAEQALKNTTAAAKREVANYRRALKEKQEAREKELEAIELAYEREKAIEEEKAALRERAEKRIAKIKEDGARKVEEIEKKIADARKEAARLEENAARARGVSFGDWRRNEKNDERKRRHEEQLNQKRIKQATTERDRLAAMNPKAMTDWQKKRLAELNTYLLNQDPNNNPKLKEVEQLEQERTRTIGEIKTILGNIETAIKNAGL